MDIALNSPSPFTAPASPETLDSPSTTSISPGTTGENSTESPSFSTAASPLFGHDPSGSISFSANSSSLNTGIPPSDIASDSPSVAPVFPGATGEDFVVFSPFSIAASPLLSHDSSGSISFAIDSSSPNIGIPSSDVTSDSPSATSMSPGATGEDFTEFSPFSIAASPLLGHDPSGSISFPINSSSPNTEKSSIDAALLCPFKASVPKRLAPISHLLGDAAFISF